MKKHTFSGVNYASIFLLCALIYSSSAFGQAPHREWVSTYNGASSIDNEATAVDGNGNVYVAGNTQSTTTGYDFVVIKYAPTGQQLWARTYNSMGARNDKAKAMAVDKLGNVYITGSTNSTLSGLDWLTVVYNAAGVLVANGYYSSAGNAEDVPSDISVADGNIIYVSGYETNAGTGKDYLTIRYTLAGTAALTVPNPLPVTLSMVDKAGFNGSGNGDDIINALTLDGNGFPIVTGKSRNSAGNDEIITFRYDPNGALSLVSWVGAYNNPSFAGNDIGTDVIADAEGIIYVTGSSQQSATNSDYVTIRYLALPSATSTSLIKDWAVTYNGSGTNDEAYSLAVYPSITGYQVFLDTTTIPPGIHELILDPSAISITVTGRSINGTNVEYHTVTYDSTGAVLWSKSFSTGLTTSATGLVRNKVTNDVAGNIYVSGEKYNGTNSDYAIIRYSQTGNEYFVETYNGTANGTDKINDISVDIAGNIYVTGQSFNGGTSDMLTIKYAQDTLFPQRYSSFTPAFTISDGPGQCGLDYVMGSVILAQRTNPPGQVQPAAINIAGIPNGFILRGAFLYFVCLGTNQAVLPFTLTNPAGTPFNFNAVITGGGTGTTMADFATCWGMNPALGPPPYPYNNITTAYRADVSAAITAIGNGPYTINGLPANPPNTDTDGATLLVVYDQPCVGSSVRPGTLFVMDGLSDIRGSQTSLPINIGPYVSYGANNINSRGIYSIGDVQAGAGPNQTTCTFAGNPAIVNANLFWQQSNTAIGAGAANTNFTHQNIAGGGDCSAIPFIGIYFQDGNNVCPPPPTVYAGPDQTVCKDPNFCVQLSATPSSPGLYSYHWSSSAATVFQPSANNQNPQVCNLAVGTYVYTVVMTDANGCTSSDQVTVVVNPLPPAPIITGYANDCDQPATDPVYTISNFNTSSTYIWSVTNGNIMSGGCTTCSTAVIHWNLSPTAPMAGTILVTAIANSCSTSTSFYVYKCCAGTSGTIYLNNTDLTTAAALYPTVFTGSAATGYSVTGGLFMVNGTFTIDADVTFTESQIKMATEAKMFIRSGKTCNLQSTANVPTVVTLGCREMWDGIYLEDNTANLNTTSSSSNQSDYTVISYARNAIVSNSGGRFRIDRTILANNNKCIIVNPYSAATHTGTIKESVLTSNTGGPQMQPYFIGNVWNPPMARTDIGIEIIRVSDIQIGDAALSSFANSFNTMNIGIYSNSSKVSVYNNIFQDNGVGVYAERFKKPTPVPVNALMVGGTGFQVNTFKDCNYGVYVRNHIPTVSVLGNSFQEIRWVGVTVQNCWSPIGTININISNNSITNLVGNLSGGILCTDNFYSTTNINNNIIFQSSNVALSSYGIKVAHSISYYENLNIKQNYITEKHKGIWTVNIAKNGSKLIEENHIFFADPTANITKYGIRLERCVNVHVRDNDVTRTSTTNLTQAMVPTVRGISLENSPRCIIGSDNVLTKTGSGIYAQGMSSNGYLVCNDFVSCWNGIYFSSATIGNQLNSGSKLAQQNEWQSTPPGAPDRMAGIIVTPIDFWWQPANGPTYDPNNANVFGLNTSLPQVTPNLTDACPNFIAPPMDADLRSTYFKDVALDQTRYSLDSIQRVYFSRQDAYQYFNEDTAALNFGIAEDAIYQDFYDSTVEAPIGRFEEVFRLIAADDTAGAINANSEIQPENIMDANRKTVNEIYLRSWHACKLDFLPTDSLALLVIALEPPLYGGDAVYSARVMLGLDPDEPVSLRQTSEQDPKENSNIESLCKLYPIPARDIVVVEFQIASGERFPLQLEIYSVVGRKVGFYELKQSGEKISIASLENGVYLCRIVENEKIIYATELIVIK